jgi:hypothetical protein
MHLPSLQLILLARFDFFSTLTLLPRVQDQRDLVAQFLDALLVPVIFVNAQSIVILHFTVPAMSGVTLGIVSNVTC